MKLVELECENCGASLKVDENVKIGTCPYCSATYKLDDEVQHIEYDNMENSGYEFEKGRIKAQKEHSSNNSVNVNSKFPMLAIIPFVIVAIVMIVILITSTISWKNWKSKFNSNSNINSIFKADEEAKKQEAEEAKKQAAEEAKKLEAEKQKRELESKVHNFNWRYSSGKKARIFVESDLNNVINTNRTNKERFITVKYNGIETHDSEEILKIIDQLSDKDYDVLLDYDNDGFITTITIK